MKDISKVTLRIIAICIALNSFSYIKSLVLLFISSYYVNSPDWVFNTRYLIVSFLLSILLGVLMWVFSDRISSMISKDVITKLDLSMEILLNSAIVFVGILMLVNTLPSLIGNLYQYISIEKPIKDRVLNGLNAIGFLQAKTALIIDSFKIVVAVLMLAGNRLFIKVVSYFTIIKEKKVDERTMDD